MTQRPKSYEGGPKLVRLMIAKGGAYLIIGVALFPASLLYAAPKLIAVLAILSAGFSLAAALGFWVSRRGMPVKKTRDALATLALGSVVLALGQGAYGITQTLKLSQSIGATP